MSTIVRGARNAFRNTIRTGGVTIILALAIGLALVMLVSLKAVEQRITSVKANIGNTVSISPAGFSGFSSVNNALTTSQLAPIASIPHVTKVTETLTDRLTTIGSSTPSFGGQSGASSSTNQTSLTSPVKLNISGNQASGGGGGARFFIAGGGQLPSNFSLPISVEGTSDPTMVSGQSITLTSGKTLGATANVNQALISQDMASKNNLNVGSTFTAYNQTITVAGIFSTSGNGRGAADTVVFSLPTLQSLTSQPGDVTAATAYIDSVDNINSAVTAIQNKLGSSNATVTNSQTQAQQAIAPLQSIETVATYSLVGALVAGSLIIFLTMLMIVRERRREIGVLKAIGASNVKIVTQFISESLTLTLAGAVVGVLGGILLANPILSLLLNNSTTSATAGGPGGGFGGGGFGGAGRGAFRAIRNFAGSTGAGVRALHAVVGYEILLYGLGAALLIAIIGSAIPAFAIAKIRPAEVMRGE